MALNDIQIVLCNPEESRNIGSVCRAMKNMGIVNLRIVGQSCSYDDEKVRRLAVHASDIWEQACFFPTLTEAIADCCLAAGTTRRRGKKRAQRAVTPEEFAEIVQTTESGKIAVVFGNERTGLTEEELLCCTLPVFIPSDNLFPSLNLSHAVQIITYSLFRTLKMNGNGYTPVILERIDTAVEHISSNLKKIGFFSITGQADMEQFWREIISRGAFSEGELAYLEGIFSKTAGLIYKNQEIGNSKN